MEKVLSTNFCIYALFLQLSLQRWLDLERATVLHSIVVRRPLTLNCGDYCHLSFLVQTNAKSMADALALLEQPASTPASWKRFRQVLLYFSPFWSTIISLIVWLCMWLYSEHVYWQPQLHAPVRQSSFLTGCVVNVFVEASASENNYCIQRMRGFTSKFIFLHLYRGFSCFRI